MHVKKISENVHTSFEECQIRPRRRRAGGWVRYPHLDGWGFVAGTEAAQLAGLTWAWAVVLWACEARGGDWWVRLVCSLVQQTLRSQPLSLARKGSQPHSCIAYVGLGYALLWDKSLSSHFKQWRIQVTVIGGLKPSSSSSFFSSPFTFSSSSSPCSNAGCGP